MSRLVHSCGTLVVALTIVLLVWLQGSAAYFPLSTIDFEKGRNLFHKRCASCHAVDREHNSPFGPHLGRIGAEAGSRVAGLSREDYLLESIVSPAAFRAQGEEGVMPVDISAGLDPVDVLSLVGYLSSLGGLPDTKHLVTLADRVRIPANRERPEIDFAALETGKRLFMGKGKCVDCHRLQRLPGMDLRAPSLLAAGRHHESHIMESIREPHKRITPGYEAWEVLDVSGRLHSGRRFLTGADSVRILTATSAQLNLVTIPMAEVDMQLSRKPATSLMPSGYEKLLSQKEIELIVKFLKSLESG